jgi:hypothetical protein
VVVLLAQPLLLGAAQACGIQQQRRKQLTLIPWGIGGMEQPIEMVPQLFSEDRQGLLGAVLLQPVLVQINRAGGGGIGTGGSRHGASGQEHQRRERQKISCCPLAHQGL